jgi:enoyl-CoA hydratase/carnithine racemase
VGGGVGLSVHGKFRVATENTLFAMPETGMLIITTYYNIRTIITLGLLQHKTITTYYSTKTNTTYDNIKTITTYDNIKTITI